MARDVTKYVVDGRRFASVTEILELSGWDRKKAQVDPETLRKAGYRGTVVHDLTEKYDQQGPALLRELNERWRGYVQCYDRFILTYQPRIILSETVVVSRKHRFGGTLDRLFVMDIPERGLTKVNVLLDVKTPAEEADSWGLQTAGYAIAIDEVYGIPIDKIERYTLRCNISGVFDLDRWPHKGDFEKFLWAANTVNAQLDAGVVELPQHEEHEEAA